MKNQVLYATKSNPEKADGKKEHIKDVANAIAAGSNLIAHPIGQHTFVYDVGILFIGCEVSGNGKISRSARKFLQKLSPEEVELVVVFSVIKSGTASALAEVNSILKAKSVQVSRKEFSCKGASLFKNKGHPSDLELLNAKEFANEIMLKYRNT